MYMCVQISNGECRDLVKKKKGYFYTSCSYISPIMETKQYNLGCY